MPNRAGAQKWNGRQRTRSLCSGRQFTFSLIIYHNLGPFSFARRPNHEFINHTAPMMIQMIVVICAKELARRDKKVAGPNGKSGPLFDSHFDSLSRGVGASGALPNDLHLAFASVIITTVSFGARAQKTRFHWRSEICINLARQLAVASDPCDSWQRPRERKRCTVRSRARNETPSRGVASS